MSQTTPGFLPIARYRAVGGAPPVHIQMVIGRHPDGYRSPDSSRCIARDRKLAGAGALSIKRRGTVTYESLPAKWVRYRAVIPRQLSAQESQADAGASKLALEWVAHAETVAR